MPYHHIPVMLTEAVGHLNCQPGKIYVDGTLGGCGHAKAILAQIVPDGLLIGIDQDAAAIRNAETVLQPYASIVRLFHGNFARLPEFLSALNIAAVDGILLDLGVSLHQIEAGGRGFSFNRDEPLDMRMDTRTGTTARELVNELKENDLTRIFREYGQERWARPIARGIVRRRTREAITSSRQLADLVCAVVPQRAARSQKIHPATRVFMALRIAVNGELERLDAFMQSVADVLHPGGRLCILAFHSLEDRIVKQGLQFLAKDCICPPEFPVCNCDKTSQVRILTRKAQRPAAREIEENPMARSTRLRAAERR